MAELTSSTQVDEQDTSTQQYVAFYVGGVAFAAPMEKVREIVRPPKTVAVPMTSPALVGLANLRGLVLPVVDLAQLLQLPTEEVNDATRVMVVDAMGMSVGLMVSRVAKVFELDGKDIEVAGTKQLSVDSRLLSGVAKEVAGLGMLQLLDVDQALLAEFSDWASIATSSQQQASQSVSLAASASHALESEENSQQLVSFLLDNQEYALDINSVEEIVRVPEEMSRIPRVEKHILGMINLRGSVLPVIDLRLLFGLGEAAKDTTQRILVLQLGSQGDSHKLGILVGLVKEVLRVQQQDIEAVPLLLQRDQNLKDVTGICRLQQGKRLVSILSADSLATSQAFKDAVSTRLTSEHEDNSVNEQSDDEVDSDTQLVVFHLVGQEFALPINVVREITRLPAELNRVPKTPDFVAGMMNLRGSVLPVIDMRRRFGMPSAERSDRQRILVIEMDNMATGFVTDAVIEVLRLSQHQVEPSPPLSAEQKKIIEQVVNLSQTGRMIQVLTASALLQHDELASLHALA